MDKWDDYTEAKEAMFFYTDTADAPWTIVKSDDKKRARLNCMQHFLSSLPYPGKPFGAFSAIPIEMAKVDPPDTPVKMPSFWASLRDQAMPSGPATGMSSS
jgi:hypothetical protein